MTCIGFIGTVNPITIHLSTTDTWNITMPDFISIFGQNKALYLEGRLTIGDGEPEINHAQVDYLPSRSKGHTGFFFSRDPRAGTLEFKPSGYQEP